VAVRDYRGSALASAGWESGQVIREYYFIDGRKLAGNQRGSRCFVDYLLHSENRHLAIIEAKEQSAHPTQGLQQAIDYAGKLGVRFVYSNNGEQIYEFDLEVGKGEYTECYPTPEQLLAGYAGTTTDLARALRDTPFHLEAGMRPRYYQELAVHAATDAIGNAKERVLLTLATGTARPSSPSKSFTSCSRRAGINRSRGHADRASFFWPIEISSPTRPSIPSIPSIPMKRTGPKLMATRSAAMAWCQPTPISSSPSIKPSPKEKTLAAITKSTPLTSSI